MNENLQIRTHKKTGHIEVICGSMFSGKTEELIRRIRRAEIARQRVKVFKPTIDNRYSEFDIVSHNEQSYPSEAVKNADEVLEKSFDVEVIGIDEAQFFENDLIDVCQNLADSGKRVIVAGLDQDYKALPFEPMPQLLSIAEYITKTLAVCVICGAPANRTQRNSKNKDQILIGAKNHYEARCRLHHVINSETYNESESESGQSSDVDRSNVDCDSLYDVRQRKLIFNFSNQLAIMKKKCALLYIVSVLLLLTSCGKKEDFTNKKAKTLPLKVGLVFDVGGRGDKSFNDAAYKGLETAKKELGVEFEAIDPGDGADRESSLRKLASRDDIGLIFGVGFIFTDDINNIAKEFPAKKFACVDYSVDPTKTILSNIEAIEFKEEEGSFLVGALASYISKTNEVGFIGGMESSLIKKFETGYKQGVKYANPECEVLSAYVSVSPDGFKNPGKAKEIALSQYSKGADIIYHASGLSGLGLFEAAREKEKLAIGVDMDQQNEAPGFVLSSMVKQVDVAVFQTIKDFKENKFTGGIKTFGLKDNGVGFVYDENNKKFISPEVKIKLDSIRLKLISGEIIAGSE